MAKVSRAHQRLRRDAGTLSVREDQKRLFGKPPVEVERKMKYGIFCLFFGSKDLVSQQARSVGDLQDDGRLEFEAKHV
jgi:hypothetical protein